MEDEIYSLEIESLTGDKIIDNTIIKNKIFFIHAKITPRITSDMEITPIIKLDVPNMCDVPSISGDIYTCKTKFDESVGKCQLKMKLNLLSRNHSNKNFIIQLNLHRKDDDENILATANTQSFKVISKEPKANNNNKRKSINSEKSKKKNNQNNKKKKLEEKKDANPTNNNKRLLRNNSSNNILGNSVTQRNNNINAVTPQKNINNNNNNDFNLEFLEFHSSDLFGDSLEKSQTNLIVTQINDNNNNKENEQNRDNTFRTIDVTAQSQYINVTPNVINHIQPNVMPLPDPNKAILEEINQKQDSIISMLESVIEMKSSKQGPIENILVSLIKNNNHNNGRYIKLEEPDQHLASPVVLNNNTTFAVPHKVYNSWKEFSGSLSGISSHQKVSILRHIFINHCEPQDRADFINSLQEERRDNNVDPNSFFNNGNSNDSFENFLNF